MMPRLSALLPALLLMTTLSGAQTARAESERYYEEGDDAAIILDVLLLRPAGIVSLVGGTALFVASLPFSLIAWDVPAAAHALVVRPFKYTFMRDMGEEGI